jgi:hypothetical protein
VALLSREIPPVSGAAQHTHNLSDVSADPVIHELGGQPDSISISPDGVYAAVAIENERDEEVNDGEMPQLPGGFVTIIDLIGEPADWAQRDVSLINVADRFPTDPEPEFIDINAANQAAVTLQENNHIVIIDLATGVILSDFSAGSVTHVADLQDDDRIRFNNLLSNSRREPDAIHWTPAGNLAVANEGDYDLDVDFVGGRNFTIFSPSGQIIFDSGAELERHLADAGFYDDSRSDSKGAEPEGIEIIRREAARMSAAHGAISYPSRPIDPDGISRRVKCLRAKRGRAELNGITRAVCKISEGFVPVFSQYSRPEILL